ncbi:MAG: hypothetical protein N0E48_16255 [Candidatus Thiodiazotropha endolucinida]|nr:hypothetical protein [Candidatus Thiodiazotropha taylori]MCW4344885.1 hypothetical protein [Candidatus Thiodiazotropha endolucinida]
MAQKAYTSLDTTAQEMLALQQFYKAVPLEMRCRIMDRDCTSIREAVDVVERYEVLLNDCPDKKRSITRGTDRRTFNRNNQSTERPENSYGNNQSTGRPESSYGNNQSTERTVNQRNADQCLAFNNQGRTQNFKQNNQSNQSTPFQTGCQSSMENEALSIGTTLRNLVERLESLERGRNRPYQNRQSFRRQNKTCYICDSPNHFFRKCPKYMAAQAGTTHKQEMQQGNGNQSLL